MIMGYRFVVIVYDVFSIMDVDLQKENYLLPLTQSEILLLQLGFIQWKLMNRNQ